jgi:alkylation response protein AidB-like acyl-CoA dehydrogenase
MYHERTARGGSPYVTRPGGRTPSRGPIGGATAILRQLQAEDKLENGRARELIGEIETLEVVGHVLTDHLGAQIRAGVADSNSASIIRLFTGTAAARSNGLAFELAGADAIAWSTADSNGGQAGIGYLMRQAACIGGGTSEMSRNVISERVLNMPREQTLDRNVPFRDVPRGAAR